MMSSPEFAKKQIVFVMMSRGDKLSFKNDNVIVKDADGNTKHQSTCYRLFALYIVGHVTVTSGLLQRAARFGFSIHFLSHNLKHYGAWQNGVEGNVLLRQKQYDYSQYEIAQQLVINKIESQISSLKKIRKKTAHQKNTIYQLKEYRSRLPDKQLDLNQILGVEGIASRVYFSALFEELNWSGRRPRVKHDINNLLLDIGYTLLFNLVDDLLNLYGFDVYQGVYHQTFYQRKSLACDLVEPFRPIIDYQIYKSWKLNQINPNDFEFHRNQYHLPSQNSTPYISSLLKVLLTQKDDMFNYIQQYYRAFMRSKPASEFPQYVI